MATQTFDIKLTANGKEVKQLMEELTNLAKKYEGELDKINKQLDERKDLTDAERKALEKQSDVYATKIKALNTAIEGNITNLRKVEDVMKNLAGSSSGELGKALRGLGSDFKRVSDQTLKSGETMEQKLTEIKEKMMEVRHEMTKREGVDAMKRAQASLTELANTPLDKLKMGLESIEKRLSAMSEAERKAAEGMTLLRSRNQYKAQIALTESGPVGTSSLQAMSNEQLRAEQQRLRSLYNATSGASGFAGISNDALNRLQQIDRLLKGGLSVAEAQKQLVNLANTPMEKLRQGLAAINRELETNGKLSMQDQDKLRGQIRQYEAEIATKQYGHFQPRNTIFGMNDEQLRAEQSKLRSLYQATDGAQGYEGASQYAIYRLQAVNQLIKQRAEAERDAAKAAKEAADQQQRQIDFAQAAQQTQQTLNNLEKASYEDLEKALKHLQEEQKSIQVGDEQRMRKNLADQDKLRQKMQQVQQTLLSDEEIDKRVANTKKYNVRQLQQAYDQLAQKLKSLNTGQTREIARTQSQMQRLRDSINSVSGAVSNQQSVWQRAITNITAYVGVFGMFNWVKNKITEVVRGSAELSDQMADIRKVSGLAMKDIEDLTRALTKLDTRTTLTELNRIAYAGAKLGFGEQGVAGLEAFVRAANQVNVALKEDLGEEALTALSKITENMQLIKKLGIEEAMLATSSAMFKLASTSTAAAGPIVEVTKRLAPVAQMSGFATHEILALSSAADSLQLMPEVTGTALSKLIMAMQNNHNLIEDFLHIEPGTISTMFKAGQSMDALLLVMEKMKGKNVTELDDLWKLLGSDGQRLITVVADMANHTDTLRKHLETSTKAFKEGTAVTEEYNIQQETAMALYERASNMWRNAFVNPDSSESVKELTRAWYDFTKSVLSSEFSLKAIQQTVDGLLLALEGLIKILPMIAVGAIVSGLIKLVNYLGITTAMTKGLTVAWKSMSAAMKANWIGAAVGLVAQLAFWYVEAADAADGLTASQKKLQDALNNAAEKADQEIEKMSALKAQIDNVNLSEQERLTMLKKFNSEYDIYLDYLGIEINSIDDLTAHYDALAKVMRQRFAYQEREEYKRDVMGGPEGIRMKRRSAAAALKKSEDSNYEVDDTLIEIIDRAVRSGQSMDEAFKQIFPQLYEVIAEYQKAVAEFNAQTTQSGAAVTPYRDTKEAEKAIRFLQTFKDYYAALADEIQAEADINAMFESEIGDFDYDRWLRTRVRGEFKLAGGGKGSGGDKAELKAAEQQAKAVIDNIKNYYERQINAVKEMANATEMTAGDMQTVVERLQGQMNVALANARKKIGGTRNDWDDFKNEMRADMYEAADETGYNFSEEILDKILDNDLDELRKLIQTLSKSLGRDGNQLLDQILRKATENESKNIRLQESQRRAILKEMLEKNYTGKVDMDTMSTMESFGIGGFTYGQYDQLQAWSKGGTDADAQAAEDFFARREQAWYDAFANARKNIINVINSDVETDEGRADLLTILFGKDYQKDLDGGVLEGFLTMSDEQWHIFYQKLLDYNDQWIDAQKKAYDEVKKRQDYLFSNRPDVLAIDNAASLAEQAGKEQNRFGAPATFGRQLGITDTIQDDPELMRYDLLQARAELYYNKMFELRQQDLISEQQLNDAKDQMTAAQMAMQDKLVESIQNRANTIQTAIKPITDFAEQAGQKLGDMMFNMDSQKMTWEEMWKNMVLVMGKSIIQMGQQYAIQKLQRSLFNKQTEADEQLHQTILTAIALQGTMARMEGEIAIQEGALVMKKIINGEEVTQEVSLATILTALGISEGASKTIAALGWLGIPLVAVIGALLTGLLTSALATAGKGGSSSSSTSGTRTKLVSNMLTYDKGNVQRFIGQDGKVYTATEEPQPKDGLVTRPIATTVQGQPALVAENGPEIVIGRQTTRAIMMNEPELIRYLADYDSNHSRRGSYHPYDSGNVREVADSLPQGTDAGRLTGDEARRLTTAIGQFVQSVDRLQQQGIQAYINMYGQDGLYEQQKRANRFMGRYAR